MAGRRRVDSADSRPTGDESGPGRAWTTKWDGRWQYEVADGCFRHPGDEGAVLVFSVTPAKVLAFAKGAFSQTSHRF
jgi:hypothetical protein